MRATKEISQTGLQALKTMNQLLAAERNAISTGDYQMLEQVAQRKMEALHILAQQQGPELPRGLVEEILQTSVENGMMVETALRFWKKAHNELLHQLDGSKKEPYLDREHF
ncbi:hypothetical protein HAP94_11385 [Acidithiobacillus ferrivorans]|nr:hypothetical protein [Acidithiobacillus ferrivorans]